jgi:hypothetical protein
VAKTRTIVLINQSSPGSMEPLGTLRELLAIVGRFNIAGDGSGAGGMGTVPGMNVLYGPGCIMEVPGDGDPKTDVNQVMVTVTDEDFAWPVLSRLCKEQKWKMMDPDSGRMFG